MNEDRDHIFIDVKSSTALKPLSDLIDDAFCEDTITVCQYRIGAHIKPWRKAILGDQVIYAIDDVGCAGGEITYLLKKAFRPRWVDDNKQYINIIHFAHGMCPKQFDQQWVEYMIERHWEAIEKKRWLFIVLAMIKPTYRLDGNRNLLLEKAREMAQAEEELARDTAQWAMGEYCA